MIYDIFFTVCKRNIWRDCLLLKQHTVLLSHTDNEAFVHFGHVKVALLASLFKGFYNCNFDHF